MSEKQCMTCRSKDLEFSNYQPRFVVVQDANLDTIRKPAGGTVDWRCRACGLRVDGDNWDGPDPTH